MSEQDQNRTEEATPYKLQQARKKGTVARGQDLGTFAAGLSITTYMWFEGEGLGRHIAIATQRAFSQAAFLSGPESATRWAGMYMSSMVSALLPLLLTIFGVALAAALLQAGVVFAPAALKPNFDKLNPVQGLQRLFSFQVLIEAARNTAKLVLYTSAVGFVLYSLPRVPPAGASTTTILNELFGHALKLAFWLAGIAALFALADQLIVRRQYARKMRMSRRELRDEIKQREGEPRIKQRRRQLQQELLKKTQGMRNIRGADVLITNPTHLAVALKYDTATAEAPCVVSKGAGDLAKRLRRLAFIYGVPIVEDKPLARKLFFGAKLDGEIPATLYRPVSSIYLQLRAKAAQGQQA
ncbi:MAG: hypothetical protein ABS43_17630 [Bordetella sp. SCN 67-23]|nr:EscU/YscU/HrcU family type III secretion system export apparatus switch protein [Burkholderiales bacterium]ODS72336.1 MAG: hypothetical protein ABS43_17630 [Bordetella sp. SCN 67-23]OJW86884.1 MAG: hypothetical protein BGO71_26480 [Burkholderiales bacterium 67-32]